MTTSAINRATYTLLLEAFTEKPGNILNAAKHAGCNRATARKAWNGDYAALPWAPCIRDVVEGRTAPPSPALALVPKLDDPKKTREVIRASSKPRTAPNPKPPADDGAVLPGTPVECDDSDDDTTEDGSEQRTKSQNAAVALTRRGLAARARALLESGQNFDRSLSWLFYATAKYMQKMGEDAERGELPDVKELVGAAQVSAMLTGILKDLGTSAEKITAAERKLNPPAPKRAKNAALTPEEAKAKAEAQLARWVKLFGPKAAVAEG